MEENEVSIVTTSCVVSLSLVSAEAGYIGELVRRKGKE